MREEGTHVLGAVDRRPEVEISAVIPAVNEAGNIGWVLERLPRSVDEVVLVDGHSVDGTIETARSVRPDIVVVMEPRCGKGAALRAGVEAARGRIVVMLDADGSMDPAEIGRFLDGVRAGHDVAKGSRFLPGAGTGDITPLRSAGNRCLLAVANVLFRASHTDLCYGFAAFRREAFLALELSADGFEIEAQLFLRASRHGLRVVEIPSYEAPRRVGNSNLNTFRDGWRVLRTILRERMRPAPARDLVPVTTIAATRAEALVAARAVAPVTVAAVSVARTTLAVTNVDESTAAMLDAVIDPAAGRPAPAAVIEIGVLPRRRPVPAAEVAAARRPQIRDLDIDTATETELEHRVQDEAATPREAEPSRPRTGAGLVASASRAVIE